MKVVFCSIVVSSILSGLPTSAYSKSNDNYSQARVAIYQVFGPYASQAMVVARCETGGTYSVYAHNGQYLGLFQMGSNERYMYGHGYTALQQARAAYRYFLASGRDWSPWACRPY